ncbi:17762_t:CDS:2 [Funneliformis geosporum]|nr:17762_t:CDS:2 [Funneliformis geosporum]
MSSNRQAKQRCSAISDDLKRQIYEWSEVNKNKKHHEIAQHFTNSDPDPNDDDNASDTSISSERCV